VEYLKNVGMHNVRIRMANDPDSRAFYEEHRVEIEEELDNLYTYGEEAFKVYVRRDPRVLQPHDFTGDGYRKCGLQHFSVAIAADGYAYPCCVLKGRPWARLGSVREESLEDIWYGEHRRAWLGKQMVGTRCRMECMYDTTNMLFTYLYHGDDTHSCYV
jgi:radical SAM protein with 4Fe4S-binding SPASM domain